MPPKRKLCNKSKAALAVGALGVAAFTTYQIKKNGTKARLVKATANVLKTPDVILGEASKPPSPSTGYLDSFLLGVKDIKDAILGVKAAQNTETCADFGHIVIELDRHWRRILVSEPGLQFPDFLKNNVKLNDKEINDLRRALKWCEDHSPHTILSDSDPGK